MVVWRWEGLLGRQENLGSIPAHSKTFSSLLLNKAANLQMLQVSLTNLPPLRAQQRWQRADAFWSLLKSIGFSNGRGKNELEREEKFQQLAPKNQKKGEKLGKRDPTEANWTFLERQSAVAQFVNGP